MVENLPAIAGDLRDEGSIPGLGKISRRRAWQPTPVFWPGEPPRTEEPGGATVHGATKNRTRLKQLSLHVGQTNLVQQYYCACFSKE